MRCSDCGNEFCSCELEKELQIEKLKAEIERVRDQANTFDKTNRRLKAEIEELKKENSFDRAVDEVELVIENQQLRQLVKIAINNINDENDPWVIESRGVIA